jgi:hypothetical protein
MYRYFGKHNQIGLVAAGLFDGLNYFFYVAGNVAVGSIDLPDGHLHRYSLPISGYGQKEIRPSWITWKAGGDEMSLENRLGLAGPVRRSEIALFDHGKTISAVVINHLVHDVVYEQHSATGGFEEILRI